MTFEDELEATRRNAEKRGIAIGEERKAVELALKLVRSGAMAPEDAADFAEVDLAELEPNSPEPTTSCWTSRHDRLMLTNRYQHRYTVQISFSPICA